jgi:hypothetical protein
MEMSTGAKATEAGFLRGFDNLGYTHRRSGVTVLIRRDVS